MRPLSFALQTLVLAAALPLGSAQAQVFKCKDASGHITYSNLGCRSSQSGAMIERQKSQDEIYQERLQAYEADVRKRNQRMIEQEREWAEQQQALQYQAAPTVRHSGNDWQLRQELKNRETSASSITNNGGRWDAAAEAQRREVRRREARAAPPTNITNCGGGFCHDNQGGVYHRVSPDFMTGPNGRSCHRAGSMWNCN